MIYVMELSIRSDLPKPLRRIYARIPRTWTYVLGDGDADELNAVPVLLAASQSNEFHPYGKNTDSLQWLALSTS